MDERAEKLNKEFTECMDLNEVSLIYDTSTQPDDLEPSKFYIRVDEKQAYKIKVNKRDGSHSYTRVMYDGLKGDIDNYIKKLNRNDKLDEILPRNDRR